MASVRGERKSANEAMSHGAGLINTLDKGAAPWNTRLAAGLVASAANHTARTSNKGSGGLRARPKVAEGLLLRPGTGHARG